MHFQLHAGKLSLWSLECVKVYPGFWPAHCALKVDLSKCLFPLAFLLLASCLPLFRDRSSLLDDCHPLVRPKPQALFQLGCSEREVD